MVGFDTDRYIEQQSKSILERVGRFGKLYLEFGGKLCYDMHAARVLPGYRPTAKVELLKQLGDIEIIYCISSRHIESGKIRADFGLTYGNQTLKDINDIDGFGLSVDSVVITLYNGERSADILRNKLENLGIKVYLHNPIDGYPDDIPAVLEGCSKQPLIQTDKKLVIMTGTGPNCGKMATCLSQIYAERRKGGNAGFAKFETFPIWNLGLDYDVNIAYEAATADLRDFNIIDPFHKEAHGVDAVNYNRDVENFEILVNIMKQITGEEAPFGYRSPTDMGVNMAKQGIIDDNACRKAARQEMIRRYFRYCREKAEGIGNQGTVDRIEEIMKKAGVSLEERVVVNEARMAAKDAKKYGKGFNNVYCGAAIQLEDGIVITGKNSPLLHAESAAVLNAAKYLKNIEDPIDLISEETIHSIANMKRKLLGKTSCSLNVGGVLITLATISTINPTAKTILDKLTELRGCEMHITHIPKSGDEAPLVGLGVNVTTDPNLALIKHID